MSEVVITSLDPSGDILEVKEIFFESSIKKDFEDEAQREAFFHKYVGYYLLNHSEHVFVAKKDRILGYCLGSLSIDSELFTLQPHLQVFEDLFEEFPAHLHINCHAQARGKGIGNQMLTVYEDHLKGLNIQGLHIITAPDAKNRFFYQRAGYSAESLRAYLGHPLLFMGKKF